MKQCELNELLLDLIVSVYKGSITKKNAIGVMRVVSMDAELQQKVGSSDWASVRSHKFEVKK